MSVTISNQAGTLAGFDIVLALSEEAVNASIQKLYDTMIDPGSLPPPVTIADFAPMPQAKHFVNHCLSLHRLNPIESKPGDPHYIKAGIDGWIECPKIRFRPILDLGAGISADQRYKNAGVEIKFKQGPEGEKSIIKYWDRYTESYQDLDITGKTIAWSVTIGRLDVEDIMEEIIGKTTARPPVADRLKPYIDSNAFTVSTIFCVFEHQKMTNSFRILDESRKVMDSEIALNAMTDITTYFVGIQAAHGTAQIPENPFILGYGISQKPPTESNQRAQELALTALPYFIPKQFILTVTPGEGINQQWMTTSGTLNFCMLTRRDRQYDKVTISSTDANAGIFDKTFFDITKTLGKTHNDKGTVQGHDGIMAFSSGVMEGLWLRKIIEDVRLKLDDTFRSLINGGFWRPKGYADLLTSGDMGLNRSGHGWKSYQTWQTTPVGMDESDPYDKQQFAFGESIFEVMIDSETGNISNIQDGINHARNLYLNIKMEQRMTVVFQTKGLNTFWVSADDDRVWWNARHSVPYPNWDQIMDHLNKDGWMLARTLELTIRSFVRINIHSGKDGTWDIDVDETGSRNLFKPGEDLKFTAISNYRDLPSFDKLTPTSDYGNMYQMTKHNTYKSFGQKEADTNFTDSMKGWKTSPSQKIRDSLAGIVEGLGGSVIMPAGDVFSFAGLDTDSHGTVYAQCNYKNESGHEVIR